MLGEGFPGGASGKACNAGDIGNAGSKKKKRKKEMQVQSLGQEDPLEEGMQHTPVFLPGESHGQRNLTGHRVAKSRTHLK